MADRVLFCDKKRFQWQFTISNMFVNVQLIGSDALVSKLGRSGVLQYLLCLFLFGFGILSLHV